MINLQSAPTCLILFSRMSRSRANRRIHEFICQTKGRTKKGMALGVLASIILITVGATLNPFDYTENVTHSNRISIAVQSGILVAFCLAISIGRLAKHRFFSPEDIDGGCLTDGSSKAKVLQSLLQNTVEQPYSLFLFTWRGL